MRVDEIASTLEIRTLFVIFWVLKIATRIHEFHLKDLFAQVPSVIIWLGSELGGNTFRDGEKGFIKFWAFCFIFVTELQYRFKFLNIHVRIPPVTKAIITSKLSKCF